MENNENNRPGRRYKLHLRRDLGVDKIPQSTRWRQKKQLRGEHNGGRINLLEENTVQMVEQVEDNRMEVEDIIENRANDLNDESNESNR